MKLLSLLLEGGGGGNSGGSGATSIGNGGIGGNVGNATNKNIFGKIVPPQGLLSGDPATTASALLTLGIRLFFILSGVTALIWMMRGAFDWITSGGEKEKISAAQQRVYNAVVGMFLLVGVLAIIATLETVVFQKHFCFGLTCAIQIPTFSK